MQAGHLIGLHGFAKGLVAILRGHQSKELALEAAWLLALITAGPEAHMHTMVKHGAAEAVASAIATSGNHGLQVCSIRSSDSLWVAATQVQVIGGMSMNLHAVMRLSQTLGKIQLPGQAIISEAHAGLDFEDK